MVLEVTITIECFLEVWPSQSMVFQWFLVLLPSLSMVFDGFGPLAKRCDGFDGSLWSNPRHSQGSAKIEISSFYCDHNIIMTIIIIFKIIMMVKPVAGSHRFLGYFRRERWFQCLTKRSPPSMAPGTSKSYQNYDYWRWFLRRWQWR